LFSGIADPFRAGWRRDLSASIIKVGNERLGAGDRTGAFSVYEERLAISSKPAAAVIRRDLLRLGFSVANPLPHRTEPPIIPLIDLDRLGEGERLLFLLVQKAPNVHLAAAAEQLAQLFGADKALVAQRRSSVTPSRLGAGMLLQRVVALRLAEGRSALR
jgi:hypothetical protein